MKIYAHGNIETWWIFVLFFKWKEEYFFLKTNLFSKLQVNDNNDDDNDDGGDEEKGQPTEWFSILVLPVYIHHGSVYIKNMCLILCCSSPFFSLSTFFLQTYPRTGSNRNSFLMRLHKGAAAYVPKVSFWCRFCFGFYFYFWEDKWFSFNVLFFTSEQNKRRVERKIHQTDWKLKELEAQMWLI